MNRMNRTLRSMIALVALIVGLTPTAAVAGSAGNGHGHHARTAGAVYTMTNDDAGNAVVVFDRASNGTLTKKATVPTGGIGSGGGFDPLASQNSIVLSDNGRWLFAVNAGSNEITVFRVKPHGLEFADKVDSGGTMPTSLAVDSNRVYVLNAGGTANITGFALNHKGELKAIANSTRDLGSGAFSQVGFDNRGRKLVVTDRAENEILVYNIRRHHVPSADPVVTPSSGLTPFAFIFDHAGRLLVVEVNGGNGAVTSYEVKHDGRLEAISASVTNGQTASCWIAGNSRGFVYTTNPGSGSLSLYREDRNGEVALVDDVAASGVATLDEGISKNGRFLYALDPNSGGIDMYKIGHHGGLTALGLASGGLATYAQGLAVR